jgi:hypothetical protein
MAVAAGMQLMKRLTAAASEPAQGTVIRNPGLVAHVHRRLDLGGDAQLSRQGSPE